MTDARHSTQHRVLSRRVRRAFSLVELMAVLLLLGIIAGIAALNIPSILNNGRVRATNATMQTLKSALVQYTQSETSGVMPPASGSDLSFLVPTYIEGADDVNDAWGKPILYFAPSTTPDGQPVAYILVSYGQNGRDDGGAPDSDDIYDWPGKPAP